MNLYSNTLIKQAFREYIQSRIATRQDPLVLVAYLIGNDPASIKYVSMKQKIAESFGISLVVRHYQDPSYTTVHSQVVEDATNPSVHGIIIQLPLSNEFINLLDLIPAEKDVDVLNKSHYSKHAIIQPTVQSILIIANDILAPALPFEQKTSAVNTFWDLHFVLIGQGKLVGLPFKRFLESISVPNSDNKMSFDVIDITTPHPELICQRGDIVICGAGSPNLVTTEWLKSGAIAIDAATSNDNGQLVGDINTNSQFDSSITIVPSPGGIGPLTVLALFNNLITLNTDLVHSNL